MQSVIIFNAKIIFIQFIIKCTTSALTYTLMYEYQESKQYILYNSFY